MKIWGVSLGLLAGAWAVVVAAMGSVLPVADGAAAALRQVAPAPNQSQRTYPLLIVRKLPCADERVTLDLALTLDTSWRVDGEWLDFVVQATLTSELSPQATGKIEPVSAHFGFSSPQYGKTGHVHEMRAPLVGQPGGAELVVGIEQGMDDRGRLVVQPGQVRVVCA